MILECRKCKSKGEIIDISKFHHKKIVLIRCTECKKEWHISMPAWEDDKITSLIEDEFLLILNPEVKTEEFENTKKTAMAIAIEKALASEKNK